MIPKKIHYCWFGENPLPNDAKKCIESWKKYLPEFEIIEWNENNFNINSNEYTFEAYKSGKYAFVSDYARLKILYENGGIYFDIDVELLKRLDDEMLKNGFLAYEDDNIIATGLGFACKKGDKVIKELLDDYNNIHFINNGEMDLTPCPIRNAKIFNKYLSLKDNKKYIGKIIVYPKDFFNPLDYKTGVMTITDNTYAIHYNNASWLDDIDKKLLNDRHRYIKKFGNRIGKIIYYFKKFFVYLFKKHQLILKRKK